MNNLNKNNINKDLIKTCNINVSTEDKLFHLTNDKISYIMKVDENGKLLQVYFGKKVRHRDNFDHLIEMHHRPTSSCAIQGNAIYSLDHLKQEFPENGIGDFRTPAIMIRQLNGARVTDFKFAGYEIVKGKKKLEGLPASYVENDDEALTLEITLFDDLIKTNVVLSYTIFRNFNAIARSVRVENIGNETNYIENIMSLNLDLPDANYDFMHLSGAWSRERYIKKRPLQQGIQSIASTKGSSGHAHNPFAALLRKDTTEFSGEVIGTTFVYSGNFLIQAEVDTFDVTRLQLGINPHGFEWELEANSTFQSPEVLIIYSDEGLNGMSQEFHRLLRTRVARGHWRDKERPILINNWEATYFDFNEEKLVKIAEAAKKVGVELFVLDDGWFGERENDFAGLGDWIAKKDRLPNGIQGLSKRIHDMDMKFGLWFEPEMVNKDSDLFRAHPDWAIHTPGRHRTEGRNQYVLNFANKEVVNNIFEQMAKIIRTSYISYIKWDMNRLITEAYDVTRAASKQGEVFHRYILGVYDLYERLLKEFPELLIESCASGGGRFDAGMIYYAPQAWASDDSDAIERLYIQYGTSMVYPISAIGAHVSAVPNHQVNRMTSIETRGNVAVFGAFGYELDLNKLTDEELKIVREQIRFVKKHQKLIHQGTFYRLKSPFEDNIVSWMVVSEDKKQAIVGYYKILNDVNCPYRRLYLKGLDENTQYKIDGFDTTFYGDELMNIGLVVSDSSSGQNHAQNYKEPTYDFQSKIWVINGI